MASTAATSTLSRRRRRPPDEGSDPVQLFRPASESLDAAFGLLNRVSLTKEDTLSYLRGEEEAAPEQAANQHEIAYNDRRREIREWAAQVESGGTEIDEHMRLVPTTQPRPPGVQLPPIGVAQPPPVNPVVHEEEERQWLEREEHEAAEAIARAVRRYRDAGVPEDDFVLIRIEAREQNAVNLTFRRICFAVLAVVTAFICIMLQTLPLMHPMKQMNREFDPLMWELLNVRDFLTHARHCKGLHRNSTLSGMERLWAQILRRGTEQDCDDGVLHIPPKHLIFDKLDDIATTRSDYEALEPYLQGVNVRWFHQCRTPDDAGTVSDCFPGSSRMSRDSGATTCFRGVHDGMLSSNEVDMALRMGAYLVEEGGDHVEIRYDVSVLEKWIPSVITTLKDLLGNQYYLQGQWNPVAFRVSVALPMDLTGVRLYSADSLLERTINRTVFMNWLENTNLQNDMAAYSLPPPFATQGERDACYLMSDLDVDPNFAVHTSVFLSDSAGSQYAGGAALYVDDHRSNAMPRNKIQRGVSIDGSRGRIIVSTGGAENLRCRLPTRAGIRAVLQMWWNCEDKS